MTTYLNLEGVSLDIPIFDVTRSFKKELINYCVGGNIVQTSNQSLVNIRALENINISLQKGDKLGLIGHNGAGKTTLLRVLAKVYKPSQGIIKSKGRIISLINPAACIEYENTGYENISSIAMYFGMSLADIKRKRDSIIATSGLGDFINLPVRTYSSGMALRLAFSIVTALEPEILLMDEGIGMGDAQFSLQAKERFDEFYEKIGIVVLASHSDALIQQLCNKAILLEQGKIIASGQVEEVLNFYHKRLENRS